MRGSSTTSPASPDSPCSGSAGCSFRWPYAGHGCVATNGPSPQPKPPPGPNRQPPIGLAQRAQRRKARPFGKVIDDLCGVHIAVGSTAHGTQGFRRSQLDALTTPRTAARLHSMRTDATLDAVQLVSLVTENPYRADQFTRDTPMSSSRPVRNSGRRPCLRQPAVQRIVCGNAAIHAPKHAAAQAFPRRTAPAATAARNNVNVAATSMPSAIKPSAPRLMRCRLERNRPGLVSPGLPSGGAAGNRTRVLRHSLKASPCAVRLVSTRISQSCEQAEMTIPVAVIVPMSSATELIGGSL